MRKIIIFYFLLICNFVQSQQLNCALTINTQGLSTSNQQVFKTLQTSLTDFINKTDWTGQTMKPNERVNGSFYITISSATANEFSGTIQIQSSRPVFESSYTTPIFNFNDVDFSFKYTEFENLNYNPNFFESNLVSVISFYCYVILGLDSDSFVEQSGTSSFESALNIANLAQQSAYKGWTANDGTQNRYFLINSLLSTANVDLRTASFNYNTGLDLMTTNLKASKEKIKEALLGLVNFHYLQPNALVTRIFFDAKSDEIVSVFSGGPNISLSDLIENLDRISPKNIDKWHKIKG